MKIVPKIEKVVCTDLGILIILYTQTSCWQFYCIDSKGVIHKSHDIFYTPEKAENSARFWLLSLDYY